jgi:hypothetical protein
MSIVRKGAVDRDAAGFSGRGVQQERGLRVKIGPTGVVATSSRKKAANHACVLLASRAEC